MKDAVELTFIDTVRREDLLPVGSTVTAAVSGGADSVCLVLLLHRFLRHMKWDLRVLHVDHGWRPESRGDASFTEDLAGRLGVPFQLRTLEGGWGGGSPEAEFSARRQGIYEEVCGSGFVAVGHTATDRAETLILRLLEGSGLRGLGGMDYRGVGPVRRPMLDLTREMARDYLRRCGQPWLEDATNGDESILRNRIRARVLPVLEEARPGAVVQLSRAGASLASWRRVADEAVLLSLRSCLAGQAGTGGSVALDRARWLALEAALRVAVMWSLCDRPRLGAEELEKTDRWLLAGGTGHRDLPGGTSLEADGSCLVFLRAAEGPADEPD